jgi:hypothetical protein
MMKVRFEVRRSKDYDTCVSNGWFSFAVASGDVRAGEEICQEYPYLTFERSNHSYTVEDSTGMENGDEFVLSVTALLKRRLETSSREELKLFRSLRKTRMTNELVGENDLDMIFTNAVLLQHENDIAEPRGLAQLADSTVNRGDSLSNPSKPAVYGVYLTLGLLSHSCSPNTIVNLNQSNLISVRAVRDISKGEPITRSWLPQLCVPRAVRQEAFSNMFPRCRCECDICRVDSLSASASTEMYRHAEIDDILRKQVGHEFRRIQSMVKGGSKLCADDALDMSSSLLPSLQNLIRLLEVCYCSGFCNVLALRYLHLQVSYILMVRVPTILYTFQPTSNIHIYWYASIRYLEPRTRRFECIPTPSRSHVFHHDPR